MCKNCSCNCEDDVVLIDEGPMIQVNRDLTVAYEFGHAFDGIYKIAAKYPWVDIDWLLSKKQFHMNDKVVAMTKCHPLDEYNEDVGRDVALRKLNRNIKSQRDKVVKNFEKYINRILTTNLES